MINILPHRVISPYHRALYVENDERQVMKIRDERDLSETEISDRSYESIMLRLFHGKLILFIFFLMNKCQSLLQLPIVSDINLNDLKEKQYFYSKVLKYWDT